MKKNVDKSKRQVRKMLNLGGNAAILLPECLTGKKLNPKDGLLVTKKGDKLVIDLNAIEISPDPEEGAGLNV